MAKEDGGQAAGPHLSACRWLELVVAVVDLGSIPASPPGPIELFPHVRHPCRLLLHDMGHAGKALTQGPVREEDTVCGSHGSRAILHLAPSTCVLPSGTICALCLWLSWQPEPAVTVSAWSLMDVQEVSHALSGSPPPTVSVHQLSRSWVGNSRLMCHSASQGPQWDEAPAVHPGGWLVIAPFIVCPLVPFSFPQSSMGIPCVSQRNYVPLNPCLRACF